MLFSTNPAAVSQSTLDRSLRFLAPLLAIALLPTLAVAQVSIQVLLKVDAAVSGAGNAEVKDFHLPKPNRNGTFYTKAAFLDQSGDIPVAGTVLLQLTGPNAATVLLRDDLAGLERLTYEPYYPTDDGDLIFQGKYAAEEAATGSIFKLSGGSVTRLKAEAGLDAATYNGTAIIRNLDGFSYANLAKLPPDGTEQTFPLFGGPVPGIDGATFKSFNTIAYNPSGQLFFSADFQGDGIDFLNDRALFTDDGAGNLVILIREGEAYPATPRLPAGGIYRDLTANTTLSCNDLGMLAYRANVDAPDARPSGSADSLWRLVPGQDPELIAVDGAALTTANAGELSLGTLTAGSGENNMVPTLDAAGNVYFGAIVNIQEDPYSRIGLFKYDGSATHLIGYLDSMLPLPEEIADPQPRLEALAVSATGRLALYVTIYDGSTGLAASLYAQDDDGLMTEIVTRNVSQIPFARQNLVADGVDYGPAGVIYPPEKHAQFIGSEDGPKHPWWTADDRLLFGIGYTQNGELKTAYCLATVGEPKVPATGDKYTWDGGVETSSWQTVTAGKTNWVDAIGARWNLPPNRAEAEVAIPTATTVTLQAGDVQVGSIDSQGTLELFSTLSVRGDAQLATVNIEEGAALIVEGNATLTGDITANETNALIVDAPSGDVSIQATANAPRLASSTASTLLLAAPGNIAVNLSGELSAAAGPPAGTTANIEATSTSGSVAFTTSGTFDAIGSVGSMVNLLASAAKDASATLQGAYTSSGPNLLLSAASGDVSIDATRALLTGESGSISASAATGSLSILSGEIAASGYDAIHATAGAEVSIQARGPIDLIDGSFAIYAESTGSSVEVDSSAQISTTGQNKPGIGIEGKAQTDVTIKQTAPINSDFVALVAFSTAGTIDIDTSRTFLAGEQGGIRATAEGGSILIKSNEIAAGNQQGIYALSQQSVSIESNGPITAIGSQSSGIFASSDQAGVSIIQNGDISAVGTNASGIVADSPTTITLQITSGSVSGWTLPNSGVFLGRAQTATLNNYGDISSASEVGVKATSVDTIIENHGRIHGDIILGSGSNTLNNHSGAFLYAIESYNLGAGNSLSNDGGLILSELAEQIGTTTLTGNYQQTGDLTLLAEPGSDADLLSISGTASLAGTLTIRVIDDLATETQYTILQAGSLAGQFSAALPIQSEATHVEDLAAQARQYPSRSIEAEVTYTETAVTLNLRPLVLDSYQAWANHFLPGPETQSLGTLPLADQELAADPDHDGLPNLAEYLFGTHPALQSASPFQSSLDPAATVLTFPIANALSDVAWSLEQSPNLSDWETIPIDDAQITDLGTVSQYEVSLPARAETTFYRISASSSNSASTASFSF